MGKGKADPSMLCACCYLPFTVARKPMIMDHCVHTVCSLCMDQQHSNIPTPPSLPTPERGAAVEPEPAPEPVPMPDAQVKDECLEHECPVCKRKFHGKLQVRLGIMHAVLAKVRQQDDSASSEEEGEEGEGEGEGVDGGEKGEEGDNKIGAGKGLFVPGVVGDLGWAALCQACPNQQHDATHHCADCNESLCSTAVQFHLLYKPGTHTIQELPPNDEGVLLPLAPAVCAVHSQPVLHVCEKDGQLVCQQCVVTTHHGHRFKSPAAVARSKLAELRSLVGEVEVKARECRAHASSLKVKRDEFFAAVVEAEASVESYFAEILAIRDDLLGKLHKAKKDIGQQHTDMACAAKALMHAARHAHVIVEAGERSPANVRFGVVEATKQLREQLQACKDGLRKAPSVSPPVHFVHQGFDARLIRTKLDIVLARDWDLVWDRERSHPHRRDGADEFTVNGGSQTGHYYAIGKNVIPANSTSIFSFTVRTDALSRHTGGECAIGLTTLGDVSDVEGHDPDQFWLWFAVNSGNTYSDGEKGKEKLLPVAQCGSVVTVSVTPSTGVISFSADGEMAGSLQYPGHLNAWPVLGMHYREAQGIVVESGVLHQQE